MRSNLDIQRLITEKIGGIISAADEAYLDQLIESDSVVAAAWNETKNLYNKEDINNNFQRFEQLKWAEMPFQTREVITPAPELIAILPEKKEKRLLPLAWAAAVVILVLTAGGWWLFRAPTAAKPALSLTNPHAGVQLQLGNGQILNLSEDTGTIHTNTLQATNNNKTLSLPTGTMSPNSDNESLTLAVPVGQHYSITLSDGTVVSLNSASKLHFPVPFPTNSREVYLSGEAFFAVAKDVSHPFLVHTPQGTVRVLGTSFNVNSYDSAVVKVSLVDGAVQMNETGLRPGQQAVATSNGIQVQPFDELTELSWRQGVFYYSNTSLAEIARVLPRWFGIPVIMDNARIAGETFTGSLERNQPINIFLENLKSTTTVDYYFDKNGRLHFK